MLSKFSQSLYSTVDEIDRANNAGDGLFFLLLRTISILFFPSDYNYIDEFFREQNTHAFYKYEERINNNNTQQINTRLQISVYDEGDYLCTKRNEIMTLHTKEEKKQTTI